MDNIREIVRSRGGTAERVVAVSEISVPTLPNEINYVVFEAWVHSAYKLHNDVNRLLSELQNGVKPTANLFIPNYFKATLELPEAEEEILLELWHLAHDLGKETMVRNLSEFRVTQNNVDGHIYYAN